MRKRVWSLLLACYMILTLCPLSAFAKEDVESVTSKAVSEIADTSTYETDANESEDSAALENTQQDVNSPLRNQSEVILFASSEDKQRLEIGKIADVTTPPIDKFYNFAPGRTGEIIGWSWGVIKGQEYLTTIGDTNHSVVSIRGKAAGSATLATDVTVAIYHNGNWERDEQTGWSCDVEVYAKPCTVIFDANGGVVSPSIMNTTEQSPYGMLPTPTRNGYNFQGWYTAASSGSRVIATDLVSGNITLYAHWEMKRYTVKFDANGGSGQMDDRSYDYFDTCTLPASQFNKERCHFVCWNTKADGSGKTYQPDDTLKEIEGTITLYAIWKTDDNEIPYCTVFFDASKYTYDSTAKTPAVTVKDALDTLETGKDYTISYRNNTNAGTAAVILTGKGDYKGTTEQTFTIDKASQSETMTATIGASALHPDETTAIETNGFGTLTYQSSNYDVAQVDASGKVTGGKAGTATITVTASGGQNYLPASQTISVTVEKTAQTLTVNTDSVTLQPDETSSIVAQGTGVITYRSSDSTVAQVDAKGVITAMKAGNATVTISASGDKYNNATSKTVSVTVERQEQMLTVSIDKDSVYLDETAAISAKGEGAISYQSSDSSVARVDANGKVTPLKPGSVTITVRAAGNLYYAPAEKQVTVTAQSIRWELDDAGKLTVRWMSPNVDWMEAKTTDYPWDSRRGEITSVSFSDEVTVIGAHMFQNCAKLTEIQIPEGIYQIGNSAFSGCSVLENISIPDSMKTMGTSVFASTALREVIIPSGVTSLGARAFSGCSILQRVVIPGSVESINNGTFQDCAKLSEIDIQNGVKSIGGNAFVNCPALKTLVIPVSVTEIQRGAIGAENLKSLTIPFVGFSRTAKGGQLGAQGFNVWHQDYDYDSQFSLTEYYLDACFGWIFTKNYGSQVVQYTRYTSGKTYFGFFYVPSTLKTVTITDATNIRFGSMSSGYNFSSYSQLPVSNIRFESFRAPDFADNSFVCSNIRISYPSAWGIFSKPRHDITSEEIPSRHRTSLTWNAYDAEFIQNTAIAPVDVQAYTGHAICPAVTVTDGETVLAEGTDYKVTYANNVYPGTATVSIVGMGGYVGTKTATFTITGNSIENANVEAIPDQLWCNAAWTPDVVVTLGSATLLKNRDYTVQYSDNTAPGTAGVAITGCNQYTGTLQTSFQIVKDTFTISYLSHGGAGTMTDGAAIASESFALPECAFTPSDGQRFRVWNINGMEYAVGQAFTFVNDTEVIAIWEEIPKETYTVTYVSGGGTGNMNAGTATEKEPFMLPECGFTAQEGKYFTGWSIGGETYAVGTAYTFTADTEVTAMWAEIPKIPSASYAVTYDANGGTGTMNPGNATSDADFTLPECGFTAPEGKRFKAWRIAGQEYVAGTMYQFAADTTVMAVWEDLPKTTFTITYDANGGTGTMNPGTATQGMDFTLPECGFTAPEGKRFTQWMIDDSRQRKWKYAGETYSFESDAVVKAVWEKLESDGVYAVLYRDEAEGETLVFQHGNLSEPGKPAAQSFRVGNGEDFTLYLGNVEHVVFKDVISPTSTAGWFYDFVSLKDITGLENLDTSNVTDMSRMFYNCSSLTELDLSAFDTGNVTDMSMMFERCSSLSTLDLSGFDTGRVTNMEGMFVDCPKLAALKLDGFNTANVKSMNTMFYKCSSLTELDVSSFQTGAVSNVLGMFGNCSNLRSIYVSEHFKVDHLFDDEYSTTEMFSGCTSLVGGQGTVYDSGHVNGAYARIDGGSDAPGYFTRKNNEYAIKNVSRNQNTVTTDIICSDTTTTLFCAIYNADGKMLSVRSAPITSESNYRFQFDGQQFDYAKAFIVDSDFRPLCESKKS